jgi:tetratricopeptide (TPR) repeat protein
MRSLLVIAALTGVASAETRKEQAAAEFAEAQRLFKAKDYVKAADRFKAAFAADEDPVYLFNIAQALRHAKQCNESRDYYKKFLAAASQIPNRDKVEKWLAEVEACATPDKPAEPKPDPPKPVPDIAKQPDSPRTVQPRAAVDRGRGRRRAGLVAIATGVVGAGAGVYFTTRVSAAERDREALCPMSCTWDAALDERAKVLDDRGNRTSTLAIASFAVGGAALVGGVVLYVTGRSARSERIAIVPVPGGAVAGFGFRY